MARSPRTPSTGQTRTASVRGRSPARTATPAEVATTDVVPVLAPTGAPVPAGPSSGPSGWPVPGRHGAMRGEHMQRLCAQLLHRSLRNQVRMGGLLLEDPQARQELGEFALATAQRVNQQCNDWFNGLSDIWREYLQLRQANTLSKLMEQEYNIGMQCGALWMNQSVQLTALLENIQIDLSYWLVDLEGGRAA